MFGFLRRFRKEQSASQTEAVVEAVVKDGAESKIELEAETGFGDAHCDIEQVAPLEHEPVQPEAPSVVQPPVIDDIAAPVLDSAVGEVGSSMPQPATRPSAKPEEKNDPKQGLWASLRTRLIRTRKGLTEGLASLVLGKKQIDDELLEDIEGVSE